MSYRNRLLSGIPASELERLRPHLEPVSLGTGQVHYDFDARIEHVVFPEDLIISQVCVMSDGSGIETATVGCEGMSGMPVFHGVDRVPEQAFVQVPGSAHRMSADAFREALPHCPRLTAMLHRFAVGLFTLTAQSSGCNRKHSVDQRCARWLLLVHDRVGRDRFELTQLFLSQMLGVRRATVTGAAGALQDAGAIRYTRGRITVVDRSRLEAASCECYAVIRRAFDYLIDGSESPNPFAGLRLSTDDGETSVGDGAPNELATRES